jgi:hypothetical protein
MEAIPTNRALPRSVRLALERLDRVETSLAESIERFADTVSAELNEFAVPPAGHLNAAQDNLMPYPANGTVAK